MGGRLARRIFVISVDTNVVLRWILDDVPEQTGRVQALFAGSERLQVDDATMIEVAYVLERVVGLRRDVVADAMGTVIATSQFVADRPHWSLVLEHYRAHPKLSVTDTHLAARAEERGGVLLTFDRKLANQLDSVELL